MRFLVTRLRFLGDIVLSTPLLDTLRERYPDARIEYLASEPHVQVLEGHPSVDVLHRLPARPGPGDFLNTLRALRSGAPIDWAFDLFSNPRSAVLVALSGARQRVGSDRGARARLYQHRRKRPEGDRSAVRHHLDKLVPLLGDRPSPRPTRLAVEPARTGAVLRALGLESRRFAVVHPGSTWPDKAWPRERWAELLRGLDRSQTGEPVLVCPPGESSMAEQVAEACGARLLPILSIPELSALLAAARLYVGNDGGVLHMAVAHRVPTVGLFGPTEPDIWFPYESWGPYRVLHGCDLERRDAQGRKLSRLGPITVDAVRRTIQSVLTDARSVEAS